MDGYSEQLSEIVSILRNNPDLTAERVLSILELNGYQTRAITPAELGRANRQLGDDIMARINEMIAIQQRSIDDENPSSGVSELATDLSNLDSLPISYEFPSVTPQIMYGLWWIPDFNSGIPALRSITNPLEKHRYRLADVRFLMEKLDNRARSLGVYNENPTLADIAILYDQVKDAIAIPELTPKGRRRRVSQLKWLSYVDILRNNEMTGQN